MDQRPHYSALLLYLRRFLKVILISWLGGVTFVYAGLSDLSGNFSTELEESAALANQETYLQLKSAGCGDSQREPRSECGGLVFISWQSVRELVHTANELVQSGPTEFSLGLDLEGLGFALRWTAGEEFSTQGNLSNNFVGGQLSGMAARVSALRHGSSGFAFNGENDAGILIAAKELGGMRGGGAGDALWSPWGSFLNASYLYGDRAPTQREDAFDFEGLEINGGIDYRVNQHHVFGVMLGLHQEQIDFDSSLSIVDGDVDMDGYSVQPFYLLQFNQLYFSASLGYQWMSFEMDRRIRYPSLNPNVDATNTRAKSDSDATALTSSITFGYNINGFPAMGIEPYYTLDYRDITVDSFTETDVKNDGFDFVVAEQQIDSLESGLGLKLNYVISTRYGVYVPLLDVQHRIQHEDESRNIQAYYVNANSVLTDLNAASFNLPTDAPESSYQILTLGFSAVLRGASSQSLTGPASGGVSMFLKYRWFEGLEHFTQNQFTGGLRYAF